MTLLEKSFSRNKYYAKYLVDEEHEGMRLDQFIQIYLASFSRQAVKEKIKNGDVIIEGRNAPHRPSVKIHHKEIITLITKRTVHEDEYWHGEIIELDEVPKIIFEDDDLLVIDKPPFMSTHPTGKHLFNCATVYFESIYKKTVHSIHRLDRETSGVLLLGKNPTAAQILTAHFENDRVKKCYFFIAEIDDSKYQGSSEFTANERMGSTEEGLKRVYINHFPEDSKHGKHACTFFKILHNENGYILGLAFPRTGRQHQIRVHAMIHGLPLIGDKLYLGSFEMFQRFKDNLASDGDHSKMQLPRHALNAMALKIPYQGKDRIFEGKLPDDLKKWIDQKLTISADKIEKIAWKEIEAKL